MGFSFTFTGAFLKVCCDLFVSNPGSIIQTISFFICLILTAIGICETLLICGESKLKWALLPIHGIIWMAVFLGIKIFFSLALFTLVFFITDYFVLKQSFSNFMNNEIMRSLDKGFYWPEKMFDLKGNTYIIDYRKLTPTSTVYICRENKQKVKVLKTNISGKTAKTDIGDLNW